MIKEAWPRYGSDDSNIDEDEKPRGQKRMTGGQCKCGSTIHQRTIHSDCPFTQKTPFQILETEKVAILTTTEHLKTVMSFITLNIPYQMQKALL